MSNRAIIEIQTTGGVWQRFGDASSAPAEVKRMLDAALRSQQWIQKARAIDAVTKQLIDMAFKT